MTLKANEHMRITSNGKVHRHQPNRVIGFRVTEVIGVGIVNPRGVAKGNKSIVVGK